MKAKLLTTSSAIALAALVGTELPSTDISKALGNPFGITEAVAQTVLPKTDNEDDVEPADIGGDDDDDDEDDDDD